MDEILVTPLGAGQDVGRSCILLQMCGKCIMLDCGVHMGLQDDTRYPDFNFIADGDLTKHVDCVLITHFHLDHCGSLPKLTEMAGYKGPIYMSHPTKVIMPLLLEDMRKNADKKEVIFTSQMIKECVKKVTTINVMQTIQVDDELQITAYYAGHVIGAIMFSIRVGLHHVVYTGDFNMTPDRHLGSAWIPRCKPDVLITESTYATTIRDSRRCRERDFLLKVHDCVERGGKVLIPVFALGRAQELCILLDTYWDRMNLNAPIFFASGLTEKGNKYYKLFINWANQSVKQTFVERNMFEFKHIRSFDKSYLKNPGPMVVLASPGMLHAGLSLNIFRKLAPDANNMLIMPGYCVKGTIGQKVISGAKKLEFENHQFVDVNMSVEYMSFSAHADLTGIMRLIKYCEPKNVLLVHGEASKMEFLKEKINGECHLNCFMPANGETAVISVNHGMVVDVDAELLKYAPSSKRFRIQGTDSILSGILRVNSGDGQPTLVSPGQLKAAGLPQHSIKNTLTLPLVNASGSDKEFMEKVFVFVQSFLKHANSIEWNEFCLEAVLVRKFSIKFQEKIVPSHLLNLEMHWYDEDEEVIEPMIRSIKSTFRFIPL